MKFVSGCDVSSAKCPDLGFGQLHRYFSVIITVQLSCMYSHLTASMVNSRKRNVWDDLKEIWNMFRAVVTLGGAALRCQLFGGFGTVSQSCTTLCVCVFEPEIQLHSGGRHPRLNRTCLAPNIICSIYEIYLFKLPNIFHTEIQLHSTGDATPA